MNNDNKTMLVNLAKSRIESFTKELFLEIEKVKLYMPDSEFKKNFENSQDILDKLNIEINDLKKLSITKKF